MKTVFEYTKENVLILPQALFAMKDVTVLKHHCNSVIFRKCLQQDLVNIEFYINVPCLLFIESGYEAITGNNNDTIELHPGSAIFLPQGLNLHSDFVKKTESLKAYLVFFDEPVITEYLKNIKGGIQNIVDKQACLLKDKEGDFIQYFKSFNRDINDFGYFNVKLQELLHLIAWKDKQNIFHNLLLTMNQASPKRNIARLLEKHDLLHLSVSDLAHISGRSLSSFNRDFKAIYNLPPKKWLQEKRLFRAKTLFENNDYSVTEVATELGYENVSNFIKAFKTKYGHTPKQLKMAK